MAFFGWAEGGPDIRARSVNLPTVDGMETAQCPLVDIWPPQILGQMLVSSLQSWHRRDSQAARQRRPPKSNPPS